MFGRLAFLIGLFLMPLLLIRLGHRFRDRTSAERAAFWGGVIGHSAGMLVSIAFGLLPPVWWAEGPPLRDFVLHWAMLVGALGGVAVGGWIGRGAAGAVGGGVLRPEG